MYPRAAATLVFAFLATIATAIAQSPAPNDNPGPEAVASPRQNPPVRADRDESKDADARRCLEFPTNLQIIVCAEKYLPHKRRT